MATRKWLGGVSPRTEVKTIVIGGTVAVNDTLTITCGYATVTITATSTSTSTTATELQAALSATTAPAEFREVTWTVNSSTVTGTHKTSGVPYTISSTPSGSMTATVTTTVSATGPNFANVAANWSDSTLPTTGDTVVIEDDAPAIKYGLTSNTDVFTMLRIEAGMTDDIGLPAWNPNGYREYRDTHWSINTSGCEIGQGPGAKSNQIKLDLKSQATALVIWGSGTRRSDDEYPIQIMGGSSATAIVLSGSVAFAPRITETGGFTSIKSYKGAVIECGITCTHTTIQTEGTTRIANTVTNLNIRGGQCWCMGQATNVDIDGDGTLYYQSSTTITAATVGPGTIDFTDPRTRTVTTLTIRKGGVYNDPQRTCTIGTLALGTDVDKVGGY